jgi:hypothetical protein
MEKSSQLRIADLKRRPATSSRLMNVRIPTPLSDEIDRLARSMGVSKTDVVTALLNEGLLAARKLGGRWRR